MLIVPVHGTFTVPSKGLAWFEKGSDVHDALVKHDYDFVHAEDPFAWSGDLDGMFAGKRSHTDWEAAGRSLRYFLQDVPYQDRNILTHSHGLQVALYAASQGTKFRRLISLTGPVRTDMAEVTRRGRGNIGPWLHVYSPWDWTQLFGCVLANGTWSWPSCTHSFADENRSIPKVGHSGLLTNPKHIATLINEVLPWLRAPSNTV